MSYSKNSLFYVNKYGVFTENKRTAIVQSSAAFNVEDYYYYNNYEGNDKKFVPDQYSSLNKRDDDAVENTLTINK